MVDTAERYTVAVYVTFFAFVVMLNPTAAQTNKSHINVTFDSLEIPTLNVPLPDLKAFLLDFFCKIIKIMIMIFKFIITSHKSFTYLLPLVIDSGFDCDVFEDAFGGYSYKWNIIERIFTFVLH